MLDLGPHAIVEDGVVFVCLFAPWTRQWIPQSRLLSREKAMQQVKEKVVVSTFTPMVLLEMVNQHI